MIIRQKGIVSSLTTQKGGKKREMGEERKKKDAVAKHGAILERECLTSL